MPRKLKRRPSAKKSNRSCSNIQRKRKFTARNRRLIYEALRAELSIYKTVSLVGIDRSTFYRWMEKGLDNRYPVHVRFRNTVNRILAEIEAEKIQIIRKAAMGGSTEVTEKTWQNKSGIVKTEITLKTVGSDWRAAAWFLERRFPDRYGRLKPTPPEVPASEQATQIKQAADALFSSVPLAP